MTKAEIRINDEFRMTKLSFVLRHSDLFRYSGLVILVFAALAVAGCSSNNPPSTQPSSAADRQDAALRDPFGYSPNAGKADISGGSVDHYDKNAMRKDLDHVLNP